MKSTKNTILITGGNSGIGYETAKLFAGNGNTVIIAGKNSSSVQQAAASLPNTYGIICDITNSKDIESLIERVKRDFGGLNILINNAGIAFKYDLLDHPDLASNAKTEIEVNYLAPINLTDKLLPLLIENKNSAIINITSILAFSPLGIWTTYSASKAAFQSYTKVLRNDLKKHDIKVFEVMPPLADTKFAEEIPGNKMAPSDVAQAIFEGFENDTPQIRIGFTERFYNMFLDSPEAAFNAMNGVK
jgi:uncharacterized oxidoreductase